MASTGSFNWGNFSLTFLKSVVYSSMTPRDLKPEIDYNDKDLLIPFIDGICGYPNDKFVRDYRREIEEYFLPDGNHLKSVVRHLGSMNYGDIMNMDRPDLMEFSEKEEREFALLNLKQKALIILTTLNLLPLLKNFATSFHITSSKINFPKCKLLKLAIKLTRTKLQWILMIRN